MDQHTEREEFALRMHKICEELIAKGELTEEEAFVGLLFLKSQIPGLLSFLAVVHQLKFPLSFVTECTEIAWKGFDRLKEEKDASRH